MNFYKDKDTGEILRENNALNLCAVTGRYGRYEALQGDDLTRANIADIIATHTPTDSYKYMLLDRMRTDCNYFLGNGNRNTKYLWGESVAAHLDSMRMIYNSFPEGDRPEWLTMDQIEEYAKQMEREPTDQGENSPPVGTL